MPENSQETFPEFVEVGFTGKDFAEFRQLLKRAYSAFLLQSTMSIHDADLVERNYDHETAVPLRGISEQAMQDAVSIGRWLNKTKNAKSSRVVVGVDWAALGRDQSAIVVVRDGIVTTERLPMEFIRDLPTTPSHQTTSIPCNRCGGVVVEFSVPNDIWNYVIRGNGHERGDEYICLSCWFAALRQKLIATA